MKRFFLLRRRTSPRSARNKKRHGVWRRAQLRKKLNAIFRRVGPGAVKRRGVNITEVFDALDRVPDAGAVFSLRLCVALPVDGDPTASMNFSGGVKAGHTFLVVGKEREGVCTMRAFGFYPATRLSVWSPLDPYPSMIRDNRRHLVHAWLEMPITALDFEVVRALAIAGAWSVYRLLSFNCAGYAVEVFNSVRAEPVVLPPYAVQCWGVPIGYNRLPSRKQIIIPHTPQGLFLAIRSMVAAGIPGAHLVPGIGYGLT